MTRVLAAPDKFRGTASASDVAAAMAAACAEFGDPCVELPLADGGEGTLDAFGGANREAVVTGPLGRPVRAGWRLDGDVAVLEMARASGLQLAGGPQHNDPIAATTRGTGELIALAHAAGAVRVIVGVGGSASTDGGAGALDALTDVGAIDGSTGFRVTVAADVRTPFLEAAVVFAPQKGATAPQVAVLGQRLLSLADLYADRYGVDVTGLAGGGAAGGLAGGLAARGAGIEPGFDLVAAELGLPAALANADLVLTGEGRLDATSFNGKVVGGVLAAAVAAAVPCVAIVGQVAVELPTAAAVVDLSHLFGGRGASDTLTCVAEATRMVLRRQRNRATAAANAAERSSKLRNTP